MKTQPSIEIAPELNRAKDAIAEDETATRLVQIWQQLLGVRSVGLHDNYFDLGGDSSLAIHLFMEIEKELKVKLPVAILFEAPTIAELAQAVRRESSGSGWSPLVEIQPLGTRPPFFCIHPHGGNVLIYRDLSRHLGSDQPFYGLQCLGLDGSVPPLTDIEAMAALYVKEIRRLQASGPYCLGGLCMGGIVAFEVAQQLHSEGEQIALLALFDTLNWSKSDYPTILEKSYYNIQRLVFHVTNFLSLDSAFKVRFAREKINAFRTRIPILANMLLAKLRKKVSEENVETSVLGQIWQTNERACMNYVPKRFQGSVTEFRPQKQYRLWDRAELKWDGLAEGKHEIIVLPVNPPGLLTDPFVKHLAVALRERIDGVIRKSRASDCSAPVYKSSS